MYGFKPYNKQEVISMSKVARLDLRLEPDHKRLLEQAAQLSETSISNFTMSAALDKAREVVSEHQSIQLGQAAFKHLLQELERPAKVLPALRSQIRKAAK
jgi:uncharacterized protein (DUF1778 family)